MSHSYQQLATIDKVHNKSLLISSFFLFSYRQAIPVDVLAELDAQIERYYILNAQNEQIFNAKMRILEAITACCSQVREGKRGKVDTEEKWPFDSVRFIVRSILHSMFLVTLEY